jgi:hypothetical protein
MPTDEPLPCPFCGHKGPLTFYDGSTFRWLLPCCSNCGATTGEVRIDTMNANRDAAMEDAKRRGIIEWNTRAESEDAINAARYLAVLEMWMKDKQIESVESANTAIDNYIKERREG